MIGQPLLVNLLITAKNFTFRSVQKFRFNENRSKRFQKLIVMVWLQVACLGGELISQCACVSLCVSLCLSAEQGVLLYV